MSKDRIIPRTPHEVRGKAADLLHAREIAEAGNAFLVRLDELIAGTQASKVLFAGDFVKPSDPLRIQEFRLLKATRPVDYDVLTARFLGAVGADGQVPQTQRDLEVQPPRGFLSRKLLKHVEHHSDTTLIVNRKTYSIVRRGEEIEIDEEHYRERYHHRHPMSAIWRARRVNNQPVRDWSRLTAQSPRIIVSME